MPYLTPPPTLKARKHGFFEDFDKKNKKPPKEVYYEDIYGDHNSDEDAEGDVDVCESDSDSEDEKAFSKSAQYQRLFGLAPKKSGEEQRDTSNDDSLDSGVNPQVVDLTQDGEGDDAEQQFKIAPNINSRRSIPVLKLLPNNRFGMFAPTVSQSNAAASLYLSSSEEDNEEEAEVPQAKRPARQEIVTKKRVAKPGHKGRIPRPEARKLLSQDLRERDNAKKSAERAKRATAKAEKEAKKIVRDMPKAEQRAKATLKRKADRRTAFVLIDNTDVETKKYRRY